MRKQKYEDQRSRLWDGRSKLPEPHRYRVIREERDRQVFYLDREHPDVVPWTGPMREA